MTTNWIAVDWGTSNLRVWVMDSRDRVLENFNSDRGMASLDSSEFEGALLELIAPFLGDGPTLVMCCGMVGSRQGWAEAAYHAVPCPPPNALTSTRAAASDPRLHVHILPGVKQTTPPDVMRGEETQIAGFLSGAPNFDGVLCMPGTHTKWVQISAGEIISFRTCMTGELFALLAENSVLRHSVGGSDFDLEAFDQAVFDGLSRPDDLAAQLFRLRAGSLIANLQAATARARLSGLLIGSELAAMRPYWLGNNIAIIGADMVAHLYHRALGAQGAIVQTTDGTDITLSGLIAAHATIQEVIQ